MTMTTMYCCTFTTQDQHKQWYKLLTIESEGSAHSTPFQSIDSNLRRIKHIERERTAADVLSFIEHGDLPGTWNIFHLQWIIILRR